MSTTESTCQCLTEQEVSTRTGLSLSTLRVHRFKRTGFPYIKIGRSVRYRVCDLEAYLSEHRIDPSGNS
ncbi:helix-turn-helix transcriptional regulator [Desulfovibrio sp. G11]|uniref:helix-turn-helix transcriptional regulator n=1 Tax=Desulfovibrio sp. G11 TaxID=631220 RepID=UPI000BB89D19|nr:transcriptional regulator [Desulfovibrio sp. G11]SPD36005.1 Putative DNA-binding domain [Desulfovibrio sp. G11]